MYFRQKDLASDRICFGFRSSAVVEIQKNFNKDKQCLYNVTLRRVRVTTVTRGKQ
jgi:hypothetical protein